MIDFNKIEVSQSIGKLKELFDNQNTMIGYYSEHSFEQDKALFETAKMGHRNFFFELINAMETYRAIPANKLAELQFLDWINNYEIDVIERDAREFSSTEKMIGHALFVSASYYKPEGFKNPTVELVLRELIYAEKPNGEKAAYPYKITTFVVAKYIC